MTLDAGVRPAAGLRLPSLRHAALPMAFAVVVLLALPLIFARPANLTSDESLYLAEAYNIAHGKGFSYPSGEPITHRAPLYPLILAPAVRLGGTDAAYGVARATVVLNAMLLMLLAWRMAGALAGAIAGATAAASSYLAGLGTTLYLDPAQCSFMLLALLALHEAARRQAARWWAASGLALALAFLVKESAVQWAPLGTLAWLAVPSMRNATGARGVLAFTLTFAAGIAVWWVWFYRETGQLYMLGPADGSGGWMLGGAALGVAVFAAAVAWSPRAGARASRLMPPLAAPAAVLVVVAWGGFMLYGLTRYSSWGYPNDYLATVPRYLTTVAPAAQPFFLIVAAWSWIAVRALVRRDDASRLIVAAALLFVPFALFSANRSLQLRDSLPIVYLSYAVLGIGLADGLRALRGALARPVGEVVLFAAVAVIGGSFALHQSASFMLSNDQASSGEVRADAWNNPFARDIARWMDANLPAGSRVLTSRLYFSSLYVNTGGRFEIRQLPTVRVDVDTRGGTLLVPRSNLFRWGDLDLRGGQPGDQWLYLKQFPGKGYWVGLSQQELLAYTGAHDVDYIVLTGDDVAFSSIAYASYFSGHPAFKLVHTEQYSRSDQVFVYSVDRSRLQPVAHSAVITPSNMAELRRQTGLTAGEIEQRLGTPLRIADADYGLSDRERWAAIAGIDLGAP